MLEDHHFADLEIPETRRIVTVLAFRTSRLLNCLARRGQRITTWMRALIFDEFKVAWAESKLLVEPMGDNDRRWGTLCRQ